MLCGLLVGNSDHNDEADDTTGTLGGGGGGCGGGGQQDEVGGGKERCLGNTIVVESVCTGTEVSAHVQTSQGA